MLVENYTRPLLVVFGLLGNLWNTSSQERNYFSLRAVLCGWREEEGGKERRDSLYTLLERTRRLEDNPYLYLQTSNPCCRASGREGFHVRTELCQAWRFVQTPFVIFNASRRDRDVPTSLPCPRVRILACLPERRPPKSTFWSASPT